MKALVAFGTKYGSTAKVAETIAGELRRKGTETTVVDLRSNFPDVRSYDLVVIGSSVIIGKWSKAAQSFLKDKGPELIGRKVALFACCSDVLYPEKVKEAKRNYLDAVAAGLPGTAPISLGLFGGEVDFAKYGMLVRGMLGAKGTKKELESIGIDCSKPYDFRDWGAIRKWARELY